MIISVDEIMNLPEFSGQEQDVIGAKLDAIELMIRKYTNNSFQNRFVRFLVPSVGTVLNGSSPFLKEGDTVQISESRINDGLYVVTHVCEDHIFVDRELFLYPHNLVTKVEYPADIKAGVINLLKWEITNRNKVGVKSETLSRHSVTYYDQDSSNQAMGYPVSLLGFLEPYKRARF